MGISNQSIKKWPSYMFTWGGGFHGTGFRSGKQFTLSVLFRSLCPIRSILWCNGVVQNGTPGGIKKNEKHGRTSYIQHRNYFNIYIILHFDEGSIRWLLWPYNFLVEEYVVFYYDPVTLSQGPSIQYWLQLYSISKILL